MERERESWRTWKWSKNRWRKKKKWWTKRGWKWEEKNLSFDECWPATLVCSQPSQPHYNRLIKSQRVRVPLASIRLRQGFHKNRFLTGSFQSNRGYSRYTKVTSATRVQTPAISKWTTFRLTTWNCSPGNPYRDFPFSFLYILLLDFLRSPPFRVFNSLPYFSKFSKFSFSNVHLNGIRGANSCILTSEHCKSKIPQCRDAETHEKSCDSKTHGFSFWF